MNHVNASLREDGRTGNTVKPRQFRSLVTEVCAGRAPGRHTTHWSDRLRDSFFLLWATEQGTNPRFS